VGSGAPLHAATSGQHASELRFFPLCDCSTKRPARPPSNERSLGILDLKLEFEDNYIMTFVTLGQSE
jgi:hypothetical protein